MAKTSAKLSARRKRIKRIRNKIFGTSERPRMRVYRSNRHIYVQLIDDVSRTTLASASTQAGDVDISACSGKREQAKKVGEAIAQKAIAVGISRVIYDRGGNIYHGRVKALSEGAREGGLKF